MLGVGPRPAPPPVHQGPWSPGLTSHSGPRQLKGERRQDGAEEGAGTYGPPLPRKLPRHPQGRRGRGWRRGAGARPSLCGYGPGRPAGVLVLGMATSPSSLGHVMRTKSCDSVPGSQGPDSEDNRAAEKKGETGPGQTGTLTPSEAPRASVPFHPTAQPSSDLLSTCHVLGAGAAQTNTSGSSA